MAVHHLDLWRFLLGSEVDQVFAASRSEASDDQTATLTGWLRNGALAVSGFSQRAAEAHEIEIYGRKGRLFASPYRFDGFEVSEAATFPGDLASRARGLLRTVKALPGMISTMRQGGSFLESYRAEWQHFISCALDGIRAESAFDDGRRALELVFAAVESAQTGHPVDVSRVRDRRGGAESPG
jgi:predicted dehydrogenase